jgi:phytoene desaturase (3,4-didehydrolycopene-forming)
LTREPAYQNLPRDEAIQNYKHQFTDDLIQSVKGAVLQRLGAIKSLRNLESHIIGELVDTPATYADHYNLAAGTPFGLSHGLGQLSLTRPGPAFLPVKNTVAVGASARPGNGVPLVLVGAKISSELAIKKLR